MYKSPIVAKDPLIHAVINKLSIEFQSFII